jgi:hypothetical protein
MIRSKNSVLVFCFDQPSKEHFDHIWLFYFYAVQIRPGVLRFLKYAWRRPEGSTAQKDSKSVLLHTHQIYMYACTALYRIRSAHMRLQSQSDTMRNKAYRSRKCALFCVHIDEMRSATKCCDEFLAMFHSKTNQSLPECMLCPRNRSCQGTSLNCPRIYYSYGKMLTRQDVFKKPSSHLPQESHQKHTFRLSSVSAGHKQVRRHSSSGGKAKSLPKFIRIISHEHQGSPLPNISVVDFQICWTLVPNRS